MLAWKIMARNTRTNIRIQKQFLDGSVITDQSLANAEAQRFAQAQADRSREAWVAEITQYEVGSRPGVQ
jgi:hypothetical protein